MLCFLLKNIFMWFRFTSLSQCIMLLKVFIRFKKRARTESLVLLLFFCGLRWRISLRSWECYPDVNDFRSARIDSYLTFRDETIRLDRKTLKIALRSRFVFENSLNNLSSNRESWLRQSREKGKKDAEQSTTNESEKKQCKRIFAKAKKHHREQSQPTHNNYVIITFF